MGVERQELQEFRSQEFTMEESVAGTDTGFESTTSRVEISIAGGRLITIQRPASRRLMLQLPTPEPTFA
jgi:hypothetical protein